MIANALGRQPFRKEAAATSSAYSIDLWHSQRARERERAEALEERFQREYFV
jgi:hypothetical protein